MRGQVLVLLERFEEGIADFDAALELDPDDVEALSNRGLSQHKKMLMSAEAGILLDPNNAEARLNRGQALNGLGQFEEALPEFDNVLELDPEDIQAYFGRGHALVGLERYEEALANFDEALERDADFAAAYLARAQVYSTLERPLEAIADSTAALDLESELPEADRLRTDLRSRLARLPTATVNASSNLRGGPGTNYPVIGQQQWGDSVKPFARTGDSQWIKLAKGAWIHASLLDDESMDLDIAQQIPPLPGAPASITEVALTATDHFNRGLAQVGLKKYAEAIAEYDEALLVDSENAAFMADWEWSESS